MTDTPRDVPAEALPNALSDADYATENSRTASSTWDERYLLNTTMKDSARPFLPRITTHVCNFVISGPDEPIKYCRQLAKATYSHKEYDPVDRCGHHDTERIQDHMASLGFERYEI